MFCELQMIFDFTAGGLFGYEAENSPVENLAKSFTNFFEGLMKFPLNIPGTSFHRCMKAINEADLSFINIIKFLKQANSDLYNLNCMYTNYHVQNQTRIIKLIADMLEERRRSPRKQKEDLLEQVVEDMKKETFWTIWSKHRFFFL